MKQHRRQNNPPGRIKATETAVREAMGGPAPQEVMTVQEQRITVQVQLPPPQMLAEYERVKPGTADLLIRWNEEEQAHRRSLERLALEANIEAQRHQGDVQKTQAETQREVAMHQVITVRRSDMAGQVLGWLICLAAMAGAVYLGINGHESVAAVLAAIPTAAIIQSFRTLVRQEAKKPASDK